jgi:predicted chitinase
MDATGDFVIAWTQNAISNGYLGIYIYAQRFTAKGDTRGAAIVSPGSASRASNVAAYAAMNAIGEAVITWTGYDSDFGGYETFGQRFDASGASEGGVILIYADASRSVAIDSKGDFVVGSLFSHGHVVATYFGDGTVQGNSNQVNSNDLAPVGGIANVAMDSTGEFIVTWFAKGMVAGSHDMWTQRYASTGLPKLVLTDAATTDGHNVTLKYNISQADISQPLTLTVYRSDQPVFDNSSQLIGTQKRDPKINAGDLSQDSHTIVLLSGTPLNPTSKLPFIVVVANENHAVDEDPSSVNTVSFRPSFVTPTSLIFNTNGSVDFSYEIDVTSLPQTIAISVFWGDETISIPDPRDALFSYDVRAGAKSGSYGPIHVPASDIVTASPTTTQLMVIADPLQKMGPHEPDETKSLNYSSGDPLTAAQLRELMPGLSSATAAQYVEPLNKVLNEFNITSLEQKSMFLAQLAEESANLTTWNEKYNGSDASAYFVKKYWVSRGQWTHWVGNRPTAGLGLSVATTSGLTLNIPHASGSPTKIFQLYWAKGPAIANEATLLSNTTFTFRHGLYTANFGGAVPPSGTSYLLVVDPATKRVELALNNILGNWSPQDAANFYGRGPIQLTGRYNYQKFADEAGIPDLMTTPGLLVLLDSTTKLVTNPILGLQASAFYWDTLRDLSTMTNEAEGQSSYAFTVAITSKINSHLYGFGTRFADYLRIRSSFVK